MLQNGWSVGGANCRIPAFHLNRPDGRQNQFLGRSALTLGHAGFLEIQKTRKRRLRSESGRNLKDALKYFPTVRTQFNRKVF